MSAEFVITFVGMLITLVGGFVRLEHRLTAIETEIKASDKRHAEYAAELDTLRKQVHEMQRDIDRLNLRVGVSGKDREIG